MQNKIAIISDIHANIYALNSVLEDIKNKNIEKIYCTGDLVGYNTNPNEVINKIKELNIPCVLGNHDENMTLFDINNPNQDIVKRWTFDRITQENLNFLKTLNKKIVIKLEQINKNILLTHASPSKINEYIFEDDLEKQKEIAKLLTEDVIIFGHTHDFYSKKVLNKLFVNSGSVGRMKDGDNRACYTILQFNLDNSDNSNNLDNIDNIKVKFERIKYNFEKIATEIENSTLPNKFANVIRTGIDTK